jgi:cysteine desulfurase
VVKIIYLDHAATTPLCEAAKKAIIEHLDDYGNPSSSYEFGRKSRLLIEDARERIAKCINAEPDEIYFTSGGSEANTWALDTRDVIKSTMEHHSVKSGYKHTSVNTNGVINISQVDDDIQSYLKSVWFPPDLIVSYMYVNNELGTIQPIEKATQMAHNNKVIFHTDAVQAVGHIPVDVKELNVDMLSASAHKWGGMKGNGFLYVKKGILISKLINGGKQESNKRGGTENVLGIVSMAAALEDAVEHMEERNEYIRTLRDRLLERLLQIEGSYLNGSLEDRVASNINIRFDGVLGSRLVTLCDLYGICISAGSACHEGNAKPSHVLKAIGLSNEEALSSIRITLGYENTIKEIDQAADIITKLVAIIREEDD